MKTTSAEIKRLARENLTHRYGIPMAAMVVTELITMVLLLPFSWNITPQSSVRELTIYYVASFVISLLGVVLSVGRIVIALRMARKQEYRFGDMFYGFLHHSDRYILATLLLTAICLIPAVPVVAVSALAMVYDGIAAKLVLAVVILLFAIAEIVLTMQYALVFYLLIDHPKMKLVEAFRVSRERMRGNKGRLFYICLSFLGWGVLAALSFGIGYLWIGPYMIQTQVGFYLDVVGEPAQSEPE